MARLEAPGGEATLARAASRIPAPRRIATRPLLSGRVGERAQAPGVTGVGLGLRVFLAQSCVRRPLHAFTNAHGNVDAAWTSKTTQRKEGPCKIPGNLLKADARTRTGDPFITRESAGDFDRIRSVRNAHEIPANHARSGCTFAMLPDRARSTWWTLNGRHIAKALASHQVAVKRPGSGRRRGGSEACEREARWQRRVVERECALDAPGPASLRLGEAGTHGIWVLDERQQRDDVFALVRGSGMHRPRASFEQQRVRTLDPQANTASRSRPRQGSATAPRHSATPERSQSTARRSRRLGSEAKRLRAAGVEVVLIQPTVHDLDVMGGNLMSSRRRHEVIETTVRTVTEHLRESPVGERLAELPAGDPRLVRRPDGPPSMWPDFRAAARDRWATPEAA
jgi:hypothetical protein